MEYDSVSSQQFITCKIVSLILCVWKSGFFKSGHILFVNVFKRLLDAAVECGNSLAIF